MPFDPAEWMTYLDTLGVLGAIAIAVWAFYTRRIRVKGEVDEELARRDAVIADLKAEHARQLAYVEERRADERAARVLAEQRLEALVESIEKVSDVMQALQVEVVRGGRTEAEVKR